MHICSQYQTHSKYLLQTQKPFHAHSMYELTLNSITANVLLNLRIGHSQPSSVNIHTHFSREWIRVTKSAILRGISQRRGSSNKCHSLRANNCSRMCVCVCIDPHIRFVWFCSNHVAIDFVRIHSLISNGLQFTHLACLQCLFAKCAKYWTWMRLFFAIELSGLDVCTWERVRTRQSSRAERITFSFLCKYSKSLLFVNYLSI